MKEKANGKLTFMFIFILILLPAVKSETEPTFFAIEHKLINRLTYNSVELNITKCKAMCQICRAITDKFMKWWLIHLKKTRNGRKKCMLSGQRQNRSNKTIKSALNINIKRQHWSIWFVNDFTKKNILLKARKKV